jgi:hypothetical protein
MEDFHDKGVTPQPFKRKLSRREKKDKKKKEKEARAKGKENAAEQLYNELPDTSFTRTVSNPEAVMKRRRQQKLEKKMAQFKSQDGGPDSGEYLFLYLFFVYHTAVITPVITILSLRTRRNSRDSKSGTTPPFSIF